MSTYEHHLTSWASTGQRNDVEQRKIPSFNHRNDLQLIGAQIFFRHGARTPIHLLPSLEQVMFRSISIDIDLFSLVGFVHPGTYRKFPTGEMGCEINY